MAQAVEQQWVSSQALTAILRPESKKHHFSGTDPNFYQSRPPRDALGMPHPPREQHVLGIIGIARHHLYVVRIEDVERGAALEPDTGFRRQPAGQGLGLVEVGPEDRPWSVEVLVGKSSE